MNLYEFIPRGETVHINTNVQHPCPVGNTNMPAGGTILKLPPDIFKICRICPHNYTSLDVVPDAYQSDCGVNILYAVL